MRETTMQEQVAEIATKASYTTTAGSIIFGLTINEIGVLIGIVLGIATYVTNLIFRLKHLSLERDYKERQLRGE
jgi:tetrahydromethanopterin S-methyltransferase subunit G